MSEPIPYSRTAYSSAEQEALRGGIKWDPAAEVFYFEANCPACEDGSVRVMATDGGVVIPGPTVLADALDFGGSSDAPTPLDVACSCGIEHPTRPTAGKSKAGGTSDKAETRSNCGRSIKGLTP